MEASAAIVVVGNRETSLRGPLCNVTGFLLAFKVSLTFLLFRSSPQIGSGTTVALTLGWMMLVAGYTLVDSPALPAEDRRAKVPRWVVLYLAMAGISLLWTTTNSISVAASYWSATVADVVAVWLLLRDCSVQENTSRIMRGFVAGAAAIAVIAWASPAMDDMRLGHEDFLHPNLIGFEFALAALFCAYFAQTNRSWSWPCAAFAITTVRTLSKGTIVASLFAGLYYLLRGLNISRKTRVYIGLAAGILFLGFWGLLESYLDLYSQGNNVETLTGRTYIWSTALDIAREKPLLGYGFDSFRWVFPPFGTFHPWHAHNEWIQQLFSYGIVGLIVVVGVYVSFYRSTKASQNATLKPLATAILILVLVRSLVDTDRFELCFPLWLMTMLMIALAADPAPRHAA